MNYVIIHTKYFTINFLIDLNHPLTVKPGQAYPQDSINEFIIQNPLLVVDFRFIFTFLHVQWAVNSHARYLWKYFYQLIFLEFDVNVFQAILSIQRYFNLTECREDFWNIHCSESVIDCWNTFLKKKINRKCKRSLRLEGIIKNIYKCWNNYYLLLKKYNDTIV